MEGAGFRGERARISVRKHLPKVLTMRTAEISPLLLLSGWCMGVSFVAADQRHMLTSATEELPAMEVKRDEALARVEAERVRVEEAKRDEASAREALLRCRAGAAAAP